jgi:hypothetical protein
LQFGDPCVDLGEFGLGEGAACGSTGGVVGEQQLDLFECEPGGLAQPDHVEAGDDRVVVPALAADTGRGLYEPDLLVLAQSRRCDVGLKREFTDRQGGGHASPSNLGLT